jgi:hypothetical protein
VHRRTKSVKRCVSFVEWEDLVRKLYKNVPIAIAGYCLELNGFKNNKKVLYLNE